MGCALNLGSFFPEMTSSKLRKLTPSCMSVSKSLILKILSFRNVFAHPVKVYNKKRVTTRLMLIKYIKHTFFCTSIHDLVRGVVAMERARVRVTTTHAGGLARI